MKMKRSILALIATLGGSLLFAQTLIDWGGNYVTGIRGFNGLSNSNSITGSTPTTEYADTSNGTIAGPGFVAGMYVTGGSYNGAGVYNGGYSDQDFIDFRLLSATANRTLTGLVLFNNSDFANSWNPSNQLFDFFVKGRINNNSSAITSNEVRLVLQSGSNYYISDQSVTLSYTNTAITNAATYASVLGSGTTVSNVTWRTYTPVDNAFGSIVSPTFTSVDKIGFYIRATTDNTAATNLQFQVYEFSTTAVVPEPGTLALVGIALGSLLLIRRRK